MKTAIVFLTLLLNYGAFAHGRSLGMAAEMWTHDSSVDAGIFLMHHELQLQQMGILLGNAEVKALLTKKGDELFEKKKALMVKAFGCGAHSSSRNNVCEVVFFAFSPSADSSQPFGRLTARVNVGQKAVTDVQFSEAP